MLAIAVTLGGLPALVQARPEVPSRSYLLYPHACVERANGTWSPKEHPVADSLNFFYASAMGPYEGVDHSLSEILWHVTDASTPAPQRPPILDGSRSLWCGKYDAGWPMKVGYPNDQLEFLYIDTGPHTGNYTLTFKHLVGPASFDWLYLIGGGGNAVDPLPPSRALLNAVLPSGQYEGMRLLVAWNGSLRQSSTLNSLGGGQIVSGSLDEPPLTATTTITIDGSHRALYFVFSSDSRFSAQDGGASWEPWIVLDRIETNDNGLIYSDEMPSGAVDQYFGNVLKGTAQNPVVSARVAPGAGIGWNLVTGVGFDDRCSLGKTLPFDRYFQSATTAGIHSSIQSCTFPVQPGHRFGQIRWNAYADFPEGSGYSHSATYRFYLSGGDWSIWFPSGWRSGGKRAWVENMRFIDIPESADSIQVRFTLRCSPYGPANDCPGLPTGLLVDDLSLVTFEGASPPGVYVDQTELPQTTFVDGTMPGLNCATPPCWPGVRGSGAPAGEAIHDNMNSPVGDSSTVGLNSSLRRNGMGINWQRGFVKSVDGGRTIAVTNGSFNAAWGTPSMIYRLFDPATKTWSPFDSTALDADNVLISSGDTIVVASESGAPTFRTDWPPRDKEGMNLPGGFTVQGISAYSSLAFLPRGTRIQYYLKATDINGGVSYQFSPDAFAGEVDDLPPLPMSGILAPDIMEFDVLPRAYAPGSAGSLLAGITSTPVLNLDGSYSSWSFQADPITQALRGLGVRADRCRRNQGPDYGSGPGGHELTTSPDNLAPRRRSNYFPNMTEYSIKDSLARWYRILIQSSHNGSGIVEDEQDARLIEEWWNSPTGTNGGDRCFFVSGDDYFSTLMNTGLGPAARRQSFGQNALGVSSAVDSWVGSNSVLYPTVDDRFAAPGAVGQQGVPLPALGHGYPVDGGCPGPNRFDALTKVGSSDAQNAAFYPTYAGLTDVAAVAMHTERDAVADNDRNKALSYGFSIQHVRKSGIPTAASNYVHSGVQERMQILYKFLASCRGPRSGSPGDTAKCWPCPTDANMAENWNGLAGFQTGQYGPLYPIQDHLTATGVREPAPGSIPPVNALLQNRPNPFNPETTIPFSLATSGRVEIRVFDVSGRVVRTLVSVVKPAGLHSVRWNGRTDEGGRAASGIYFYRITYPDGSVSAKKLTMLR